MSEPESYLREPPNALAGRPVVPGRIALIRNIAAPTGPPLRWREFGSRWLDGLTLQLGASGRDGDIRAAFLYISA